MYNVVFIAIDKIEKDFYEKKELLGKVLQLKNNIERVCNDYPTKIYFTALEDLKDVQFMATSLINFFDIATYANDYMNVETLLTNDKISDLKAAKNYSFASSDIQVGEKQVNVLNEIGMQNIAKVIHITNGIDYYLHDKVKDIKNIVFSSGYEIQNDAINSDVMNKDTIYVLSEFNGLDGFNDCFNTYFENVDSIKLTKEKN